MISAVRLEDSIAYRIHIAARLLRVHFLRIADEGGFDLTPEQWFVLNKLDLEDGQSQTDLGEEIFADRPNMTRLLTGMERKGLVKRGRDPDDGRKIRVHLTAKGRRTQEDFAREVRGVRKTMFGGIAKRDLEAAFRVIDHLEAAARA